MLLPFVGGYGGHWTPKLCPISLFILFRLIKYLICVVKDLGFAITLCNCTVTLTVKVPSDWHFSNLVTRAVYITVLRECYQIYENWQLLFPLSLGHRLNNGKFFLMVKLKTGPRFTQICRENNFIGHFLWKKYFKKWHLLDKRAKLDLRLTK